MPLAVMQYEAANPGNVLLLGVIAVVLCAELVPHLSRSLGLASMPYSLPGPFDAYQCLWSIYFTRFGGESIMISGTLPQFPDSASPPA